MKKKEKSHLIDSLNQILKNSNSLYITDTQGLNANQISEFRRVCFTEMIEVKVVKNTLLKKAIKQANKKNYNQIYNSIKGNTTILFSNTDTNPSLPAKLIIKNLKKILNKPILKVAWIDQSVYIGDNNLEALSKLKSRHELIGEILFSLQLPIQKMLSSIKSESLIIARIIAKLSKK